jgi:nucleotide-binding universal stress UspA family protein
MEQPIIVPLDGSPLAEQALPYAELLARACGAPLLLVEAAAVLPRPREADEQARARTGDEAEAHLAAVRGDLSARGTRTEAVVEMAPPADVIRETARARDARLIVMTTHGWGGASPWVLGSVAEQVLRRSHLPVLFLSPQALTAGDARRLRERTVVPTDGSTISERIFPTAQRLARCLRAPVTLVRVVDPLAYYRSAAMLPYGSLVPPTLVDDAVAAEQATLEAEAARWRGQGIATEARVPTGSPSEAIVGVAGECRAGWLALASHGRGGIGGFVLGSTARRVLHRSHLPVLVGAGHLAAAVGATTAGQ